MAFVSRTALVALAVLAASSAACSRLRALAEAPDAADAAEAPGVPIPAFPGAEGFGAGARGGRGGPACHVRTLANLVGNVMARRSTADADAPLVEPSLYAHRGGAVYSADNALLRGAATKGANGPGGMRAARHAFPTVTYTPASAVVAMLAKSAGAWPRDAMDERLSSYLTRGVVARPASWKNGSGVDVGDAFARAGGAAAAAPLPVDTEGTGCLMRGRRRTGWTRPWRMGWLSGERVAAARYAALECYVNELADARVPR